MIKSTLTIAEASVLTGLSKRALARRIERGQLRATKAGGLRYVEARELAEAGLLDLLTGQPPRWRTVPVAPEALARELVETLARQGIEIHDLRQRLEAFKQESGDDTRELRDDIEQARREREELRKALEQARREREELRRALQAAREDLERVRARVREPRRPPR